MIRALFIAFVAALMLMPVALLADDAPIAAIQDNSFLLEEAYNQEPGVIQHISFFTRNTDSGDWLYTFTEEFPAGGLKHQLSYTLAVTDVADQGAGLGDVALNYRYQLVGNGESAVAVAPRLSVLFPSGDVKKSRGMGGYGIQVNLPASFVLSPRIAAHSNLGGTWIDSAEDAAGDQANSAAWSVGQSFVFAITNRFQFLVEGVYGRVQTVTGAGQADWQSTTIISPAVRWSYDFPSGLQIVPGIGMPMGVGSSAGDRSVLLYLSFEHPVGAARKQ